ncbi:MAG: hypothetical protein PW786_10505 [Arachidicoccus sp.]|nr:hypothetical protein [Arachidicoccus sp.]
MHKRKFDLHNFAGGTVLSREQMKNVLGGIAPSGGSTSCSCTLKSSGGVKLSLPDNVTSQWTTDADCKSGCNTYCQGANQAGGDCANYSYTFTQSTIAD